MNFDAIHDDPHTSFECLHVAVGPATVPFLQQWERKQQQIVNNNNKNIEN